MAVLLGNSFARSHYEYEHRITPVKTPAHPSTVRLLSYWRECDARGGMRMGRDVPARAISKLLRDITVAEPVGDWADARIRLAGFGMVSHFGRDIAGALMSEIMAGRDSDMHMLLQGAKAVIAKNRPGTIEQILLDNGREVLRQELTVFPLHAPDGNGRWSLTSTFDF